MSKIIRFLIPCEIEPKQSDRTSWTGSYIRHYQPVRVLKNARELFKHAVKHRPKKPWEGPLGMRLTFMWPWPSKKYSKKERAKYYMIYRDTKPDFDNCCKQICDVLQQAGFYKNDSQLVDVWVRKFWADQPGIDVKLSII